MINGAAHISRISAFKKPEQQFKEVTDDIYPPVDDLDFRWL
jgi:hypothetical protein